MSQVIRFQPQPNADRLVAQARALHQQGRLDAAKPLYRQALAVQPAHFGALHNLAILLLAQGDALEAAGLMYRAQLTGCEPAQVHYNLGLIWQALERHDAAEAAYRACLALTPDNPSALCNLGNTLCSQMRHAESLACYEQALALLATHRNARANQALALLRLRRYDEGWAAYAQRQRDPHPLGGAGKRWTGAEPLAGKTILLYAEQGLGDTLHFMRYARDVRARGAKVLLEVQGALAPLLAGAALADRVLAAGEPRSACDFHCALPDLPGACGTQPDALPGPGMPLLADPAKIGAWRARLGEGGALRVGLICSGNPRHLNDRNRSLPASVLAALKMDGVELHCLQKEVRPDDRLALAGLGAALHDDKLDDFSDTAALLACMDLVVSVDTSIAHLAGAMGKPLWLLLPFVPDWRWPVDAETTAWYPSARLFRQDEMREWPAVVARAAQSLRSLLETQRVRVERCPVCGADAALLDTVDFNKACLEPQAPSGLAIDYCLCDTCGFAFAPDMHAWPPERFREMVYNEDYVRFDPHYDGARPENMADRVEEALGAHKGGLRHLDYGGGSGALSGAMRARGWDSSSYDPLRDAGPPPDGQYDVVTAIEVFEHVPDLERLFADLAALCKPDGIVMFTTMLADGHLGRGRPLDWWYAAPRNGHISLFSREALRRGFARHGMRTGSFSATAHIAFRELPAWAKHLAG